MKMFFSMALFATLATFSVAAHAQNYSLEGGGSMVGGGDVHLAPALICDAAGIDITHPVRPVSLEVAYEVQLDGLFHPGMTLKVLTRDAEDEIVSIYQASLMDIPASLPLSLNLYDYVPHDDEARVVAHLEISESQESFSSALRPTHYGYEWGADELTLSNCQFNEVKRK